MGLNNFTWGKVLEIHEIGEYQIIEFDRYQNGNPRTTTGEIFFHPYLNEKDLHQSFNSLDEALIFVIAYKNEKNPNTKAHLYFYKMIGLE